MNMLRPMWINLHLASGLHHVRVLKALKDKREVRPSKVDQPWVIVEHACHPPRAALGLGEADRHHGGTPQTLLSSAEVQQSSVADGGICRNHLSEALAQGSDGIERLVVDEGPGEVDLGEEGEVVEELDEESRLDRGAMREVEAEQVVTLFLIK